jgi:predicted RND superfamily exporter protein
MFGLASTDSEGDLWSPGIGRSVALSGLTTALGFVAISVVPIDTIRQIGAYGALGVFVALVATLSMLPALFGLGWIRPERRGPGSPNAVGYAVHWLVAASSRRPRVIVGAFALFTVVMIVGATLLNVETDVVLWFPKDHKIRRDYDEIGRRFAGISPVQIIVTADEGRSLAEPEVMRALAELGRHIESLPTVGRALSIASLVHELQEAIGGSQTLDKEAIEQLLLVLESEDQVRDLIDARRTTANVVLRVDDNGSNSLLGVGEAVTEWWDENGPAGFRIRPTGIMYEFARAQNAIAAGQLQGLGLAALVIGLVLWATTGSVGTALLASVPNAIPVIAAFGTMGFFGIPLDAGTVLVGNLALGIAVDDTIHVISGYSEGKRMGLSGVDSVRACFEAVFVPVFLTTVVISVAFGVLGLSNFVFIRNLGLLTAGVMVFCLLADLLLLPALLALGEGK